MQIMSASSCGLRDRAGRLVNKYRGTENLMPTQDIPSLYRWGNAGPKRVNDLLMII